MLHICNLYKRGTRINIEYEMFIRHIFLSILYIFMTTHSAQAEDCPAGNSLNNEECSPCPTGTWSNTANANECKNCPAGWYQKDSTKEPCTQCPVGRKQNAEKQVECDACIAGQYQDVVEATFCKDCPMGREQPNTGQASGDSCIECEEGKYGDQSGQSSCTQCETGQYQTQKGQTSCTQCETGQYQTQKGQTSCTKCSTGRYGDQEGLSSLEQCKECSAGRYGAQEGLSSDNQCTPCAIGKFWDSPGLNYDYCKICLSGKYGDVAGLSACKPCSAGKYSDATPGQYAGLTSDNQCKTCAAGKWSDQTGLTAENQCVGRCSAGKFSNTRGLTADDQCEGRCSAGKWSDQTGLTADNQCKTCAAGKWSDQTGLNNQCEGRCSAGKWSDQTGLTADNQCAGRCSNGKYSDQTGLSSDSQCKKCSAGKYSDQTGSTLCDWCVKGGYQNEEGQTTCKECPSGKTTDNFGAVLQQECEGCPTGKNADAATKTCFKCPRGKIINGTTCTSCEQGQFSDEPDSQACNSCEGDSYQDEEGQTTCKECPTCYNMANDRKSCKLCEGNTFPNAGVCESCPSGKFIRRTPGCDENDCAECPGAGETSCYGEYEHIVFESGTVGDISTAKERCKDAIKYVLGHDVDVKYIDNADRDYGCGYYETDGYINNNTDKDSNPSDYKGLCVLKTNATHYAEARGMSCDGMKAGPNRIVRGNRIFGGIQASLDTVITTDGWTPTQPDDDTPSFCQPGYIFSGSACTKCTAGKFSDAYVQSSDGIVCVDCSAGKYSSDGAMQCTNCPKGWSSETGQDTCTQCDGCLQGTVRSSGPGCACESCKPGTFIGFSFASVGLGKCSSTCKITTTREFTIITKGTCDITVDSPTVCAPDGEDLTDILEIRDAPTGCITYAAGERKGKWFFNYLQTNKECSVFSPCRCMTITKTCESDTSGPQVSAQECGEQCNTLGKNLFSVNGTQDSWSDNATDYIIDGECAWECNQEQDIGFKGGMKLRLGRADSITECFQRIRQEYPEARGASISNDEECYAHFYLSDSSFESDTGNKACKFTPRAGCTLRQCLCATESGCSLADTQMTWHTFRTEGTTGQKGQCTACPRGRYSMGSSDSCIDCPKGRYSTEPGTSVPCKACNTCPVGWRMDTSGQSSTIACDNIECVVCPVGYYQDEKTHDECKACGPNSYQNKAGQSTCKECENCVGGKTRRTPASTACSDCESCGIGAFCESGGIELPCPVGKYNDQVGQITCKDCPAGKSLTVGQAECT